MSELSKLLTFFVCCGHPFLWLMFGVWFGREVAQYGLNGFALNILSRIPVFGLFKRE